jgi:sirohydrochlorin cobaltochelatase
VLLFAVGSSDTAANQAVVGLAEKLGEERLAPAAAGFGTTAPRARDVLRTLPPDPVVLPLFVSPGLLLDALAREVAGRGLPVLDPLGPRLAPLVRERYAAVIASLGSPSADAPERADVSAPG